MGYLSVSASKAKALNLHTQFNLMPVTVAADAIKIITKNIWSPIVWINGRRSTPNFLYSDYCALDFDDTLSIDDAIGIFKDYRAIVAPTENHRKVKNGVYADRFRVIVPWTRRISCREEYRSNMLRLITEYGADASCKDAGRLFKPSVSIALANDGDCFDVAPAPPPQPYRANEYTSNGQRPLWLQEMIARGSDGEPGRNLAAFKIASACLRCSIQTDEIFSILQNSFGVSTLSDRELAAVIQSAKKINGAIPAG